MQKVGKIKQLKELEKKYKELKLLVREIVKANDYWQRENQRLEEEKCELLGIIQGKDKMIAELKKEVEKHKWDNIFLEDCADYDKKITEEYTASQGRVTELEEENAELQQKYLDEGWEKTKLIGKLTEAKGIIKTFVDYEKANAIILNYNEFLKRAEDFIRG